MAWVGGKKALREEVLARFPLYYERYIEVFGGGGWVLFHKPPGTDFEVYNDLNGNLAALYRAVRDHPRELQERLRYVLNSREDFIRLKQVLEHPEGMEEVARAAAFYQVIRYSYAAGCGSFAAQPHSMWGNFPLIDKACARLQKVVVENKDFEKLIRQYDRPVSFFYCDPPYVDTEDYYSNITFGRGGHERLRDTLLSVQGKFLLSYNDHPLVWEMYDRPGIYIERVTRLNNMKQRYDGGAQFPELFVSNYDQSERIRVPFPVSWTVKMKKKQKETQDILSYHSQAAGCSDKARAKASGGRQPIEECGRTGL